MKESIIQLLNSNVLEDRLLGLRVMLKENLTFEIFHPIEEDPYIWRFKVEKTSFFPGAQWQHIVLDGESFVIYENHDIFLIRRECQNEIFRDSIIYNDGTIEKYKI